MNSCFLKSGIFLLYSTLIIFSLSPNLAAQSDEEMQILRMFYRKADLVVSSTRNPKPISQVAENITIITARDIEAMNAHTIADVLERVPGLFINYTREFGAISLIQIQGSEQRHVLVLVDGVTWNYLSSGGAETNSIPVGIIERIEVIKGPASSAWGSSLGGVVNIITKAAGDTKKPGGSLIVSYGERNTQDYRAELSGRYGSLGYYLYAGHKESDGLRSSRGFDNDDFYGKFDIPFSDNLKLGFSFEYSEPEFNLGDYPSLKLIQSGVNRTFFSTTSLAATINREISLDLSFRYFKQKSLVMSDALGLIFKRIKGNLYLNEIYDEETWAGSAKLVWNRGIHTMVSGVDVDRGELDQTIHSGRILQLFLRPPILKTSPDRKRWAVYLNDTILIDRWSITPGIRYDYNDITGSFTSPSLGVTYRFRKDCILRASVARGFTIPPLSWTSGGTLFLDSNPSLDPEEVWSYQAGVESSALKYLWLKATFFLHDLENSFEQEPFSGGWPTFNDQMVNKGEVRRKGFELEAETLPFHNLILRGGFAFVDIDPKNYEGSDCFYSYNIGIRYDDQKSIQAELFGKYLWWDLYSYWEGEYDDFIWDLNLRKKIFTKANFKSELFLSAHNLFNDSQYNFGENKNPERWIEAGIKIKF